MKDLPLEKLVTEKSNKKQITGFLESLGRWKNKQKDTHSILTVSVKL